ncbi:hypothetical protein bcgnr5390_17460 [Bacillus luti]|nr:hypothetical protein BC2903_61630 [Bacillus cereus]
MENVSLGKSIMQLENGDLYQGLVDSGSIIFAISGLAIILAATALLSLKRYW